MIRNDQALDLQYTYIKDFDISEIGNPVEYKLKDLKASNSFWDGFLYFNGIRFIGDEVNFNNAQFGSGDVSLDYTQFMVSQVSFVDVQFGDGSVSFVGAKFNDCEVCFDHSQFGDGEICFDSAEFINGYISFVLVFFGSGEVCFDCTQFVNNNVSYYNARFGEGNVSFQGTRFGDSNVSFENAQFNVGDVIFNYAQFGNGDINFLDSSAQRLIFYKNTFPSHVDLRFDHIDKLIVQDCIIEKTLKCENSVKYQKLSFLNTVNLGHIYLDWKDNNVFHAILDGAELFAKNYAIEEIPFTTKEKASQFRMLKENFHNIGYYDDEDKAYRAYMKFKTNNLKRCWMKIFGLIGGYGTQAWKVMLAALAVIAAFGGIFTVPMQSVITHKISFSCSFFKGLYFSAITFLTIGYGDISPPNQTVALLAGIEGFLGLFLMSYFTVCVVRKLLR